MDKAGSHTLFMDLEAGDRLEVKGASGVAPAQSFSVTLLAKSGKRARVRVVADKSITVCRVARVPEPVN